MCISRILAGLSVCLVPFLSVSAEAGVVDKVSFGVEPTVVAELVSQSPGESRYRIVSNSPFRISASNVIGPIKTRISRIGAAAQSPGPHTRCRIKLGALPSVIYKAKRRTAQIIQSCFSYCSHQAVQTLAFGKTLQTCDALIRGRATLDTLAPLAYSPR